MKKYVITGSIGNISKQVVEGLVKAGKEVTVITSKQDKVKEIESMSAKAFVGSVDDAAFVAKSFAGAEVVYLMIPPIWATSNWKESQLKVANAFVSAIKANNIKYAVLLSSIGAHMESGNGPVDAIYDLEQMLNSISGLNVKHLRPGFFYTNLLNQIGMIKNAGIMGANYGGADKLPMVDTTDIAAVVLDELLNLNFTGHSARYILSDIRTVDEVTKVLSKAIGKEVPWVLFSDEDQLNGMLKAGLPQAIAGPYTDMGHSLHSGAMVEEGIKAPVTGKVKLEDFARIFARAYNG